jgi:RNA polymerase sigma-70 factor (ECF subfamily)
MKNGMDAEDAVQETFYKYYRCCKQFESDNHIKAWLILTASNYCKDLLKHWWRKKQDIDECRDVQSNSKVEIDELMSCIMELPDKYKTTVYMYYYEGYNSREIADIMNKSESTVRTYLQRARNILKKKMVEGELVYEQ